MSERGVSLAVAGVRRRVVIVMPALSVLAMGAMPMQFAQAALPVTVGCSSAALVSAIATANAGGASDLLLSPGCMYTLTAVNNTTDTANGLPQVTGTLNVHGNGAVITRSATAPPFRILEVGATGKATLNAVTISNGAVNTRSTGGAGIHNAVGGRLTMTGSQIINNVITEFDGHGAGLLNDGYADVTGSVISGNSIPGVDGSGGGIYNDGGGTANAQIKSTVIRNNTVGLPGGPSGASPYGLGGGIANYATMAVTGSTIAGNSVIANGGGGNSGAEGGGIADYTSTAGTSFNLTSSLVTGNSATASGASGRARGGGIVAQGKVMTLWSTTVSNNSISLAQLPGYPPMPPSVEGAGIQNDFGNALWLQNGSHVLNNTASSAIVGVTVSGGGIENDSGTVDLMTASTVAGNSVSAPSGTAVGGGINNDSGPGTVNLTAGAVVANTPDNCAPAGTIAGCSEATAVPQGGGTGGGGSGGVGDTVPCASTTRTTTVNPDWGPQGSWTTAHANGLQPGEAYSLYFANSATGVVRLNGPFTVTAADGQLSGSGQIPANAALGASTLYFEQDDNGCVKSLPAQFTVYVSRSGTKSIGFKGTFWFICQNVPYGFGYTGSAALDWRTQYSTTDHREYVVIINDGMANLVVHGHQPGNPCQADAKILIEYDHDAQKEPDYGYGNTHVGAVTFDPQDSEYDGTDPGINLTYWSVKSIARPGAYSWDLTPKLQEDRYVLFIYDQGAGPQ